MTGTLVVRVQYMYVLPQLLWSTDTVTRGGGDTVVVPIQYVYCHINSRTYVHETYKGYSDIWC